MKKLSIFLALFASVFSMLSCKETESEITPILTESITEALNATITDEYKAQVTYDRILSDFGADTRPFVNIKKAEVKHADAIAGLMNKYQIVVPTNEFKVAEMPVFQTVKEACAAGVEAEIENIAIYDTYLTLDLPQEIRNVFESNRAASLNNHLPAFQNCSE